MLKQTLRASVAMLLFVGATTHLARAQDNSALLDLLVKKKVLTPKEAESVKADLIKENAAAAAAAEKVKVGSWVQEMKIGGDLRMRYQYDSRDFQVSPPEVGSHSAGIPHDKDRSPSGSQRSRWRFRLRLNDDFKLADGWFGGVQLQTNLASDSGNQTFGDPGSVAVFSKYPIFISRAYLGWNASDWLTIVACKQPNPFYTTDMVWDPDINPDGLVETVRFHKLFASGSSGEGGYSKDGKNYVAPAPAQQPWELTMNLGEFIFMDNLENGGRASEPGLQDNDISNDAYLFVGQLVGTWHFDKNLSTTIAPGIMFFNAARLDNVVNENFFADAETNATGATAINAPFLGETRNLIILTAPGDISFKLWNIPTKLYWD